MLGSHLSLSVTVALGTKTKQPILCATSPKQEKCVALQSQRIESQHSGFTCNLVLLGLCVLSKSGFVKMFSCTSHCQHVLQVLESQCLCKGLPFCPASSGGVWAPEEGNSGMPHVVQCTVIHFMCTVMFWCQKHLNLKSMRMTGLQKEE